MPTKADISGIGWRPSASVAVTFKTPCCYSNLWRLTKSLDNTLTSFVRLNVSLNIAKTLSSAKNFSTAAFQTSLHDCNWAFVSPPLGGISESRTVLAIFIQSSRAVGEAVLSILPENRLLTRFSSRLTESILVVKPMTATPLFFEPAWQLWTVSSRQYKRDCRGWRANRSNASRITMDGRGSVVSREMRVGKCVAGGSVDENTVVFVSGSMSSWSSSWGWRYIFPVWSLSWIAISRSASRSVVWTHPESRKTIGGSVISDKHLFTS